MEMKIDIKETEFYEQSFEQLVFNVFGLGEVAEPKAKLKNKT